MKLFFYCALFSLIFPLSAYTQQSAPVTHTFVSAKFINGDQAFSDQLRNVLRSYLDPGMIKFYQNAVIYIAGQVSEQGQLVNMVSYNTPDITKSIITRLTGLTLLEPATLDGQPARQNFNMRFVINPAGISFNWVLLGLSTSPPSAIKPDPILIDTINAVVIKKDSVNIPYNENYYLASDSCAQIIRHAHYDIDKRIFRGKFKDVKAHDTSQIVAEGNYSNKGLKDGKFVMYYLDGKLQAQGDFKENKFNGNWIFYYPGNILLAKGAYKDNEFVGNWETYYEDGKPELFFDVEGDKCKIMDAWTPDGVKVVNNGNGYYKYRKWEGKIVNGLPDSIWTFHIEVGTRQTTLTEYFKQNVFYRGYSQVNDVTQSYNDESHIDLLPRPLALAITSSDYLAVSFVCNGVTYKQVYVKLLKKIIFGN